MNNNNEKIESAKEIIEALSKILNFIK